MEFRNQEKSMGIPSSFRYDNHHHHHHPNNQDPRREINGDDAVLSPSPDRNHKQQQQQYPISNIRRNPDPNQIGSEPEPAGAITVTRYRECQKNHAAHMGSHVVDGCGEFMAASDDSMRCAVCECHRNFHRKETNSGSPRPAIFHRAVQLQRAPSIHGHGISAGTMMAFGGGVHAESSSEDLNQQQGSRKRFRTKFTEEQKGKMMEMADKIGWRIQKEDEEVVQRFCVENGVKRQVFKVWMHNNRQAIKRKHST